MTQILDLNGNPLKKSLLTKEEASPEMSGVRSIFSEDVALGVTPDFLANLIRSADSGNSEAYLTLAEQVEEKESHYHSVLGTRKRQVAQLDITVEPASDDKESMRHAKFVEDWLDRDALENELIDILDAIGKGFSCTEIIWDTSEKQWTPHMLKWRDPRFFHFDQATGEQVFLKTAEGSKPLTPYKYITHIHKAKSGLPIRGGVIRPVLWMWLFKNFSIKDWVIFAETYGQPIRVGKYGTGSSEEDRRVLMRAVANIGSDAAAIIPESMQIEFIEAGDKSKTSEVFEKLARYCDEQISKAVLGQTMTTDSGSSRSQAEVHNEVKHDIERSDSKQLSASLNQQLVKPIIDLNFGAQKKYPRIRIGRPENHDIEKIMKAAKEAHSIGVPLSIKDIREKTNFREPESEDDKLVLSNQPEQETASELITASENNPKDSLEVLSETAASDWEEIVNPYKQIIEQAANEASSFEEFSQKLLEVASELDLGQPAEKIAQALFSANLAGQLDVRD
ncbi:MAG: hypothetical protein CBB87_08120 [Micavibrio sp. TMED27]|nr:hypothetical protein [Micavibrio sp.]OUT90636.1 MAG: hypothetical protein CBB87_08120 [Micavibrio sp. TMED27]|tara:strand:- start:3191 stop:4711 length:1521 start_codon:yes stop_codon:yes gene_type:complete